MRLVAVVLVALVPGMAWGKGPPRERVSLQRETTIEGLRFPAGTQVVYEKDGDQRCLVGATLPAPQILCGIRVTGEVGFTLPCRRHADGASLMSTRIAEPLTVDDVALAAGDLTVRCPAKRKQRRLVRGVLARATTLGGHALGAGTTVSLSAAGRPEEARLVAPQTLQGIALPADTTVRFDAAGRIASLDGDGEIAIDGLRCRLGSSSIGGQARLAADGHLASCDQAVLEEAKAVGGLRLPRGTGLGRVLRQPQDGLTASDVTLVEPLPLCGLTVAPGTTLKIERDGIDASLSPAAPMQVGGVWFERSVEIHCPASGKPQPLHGMLARPLVVGKDRWPAGSALWWSRDGGGLYWAKAPGPVTIQGITAPRDARFVLEAGRVVAIEREGNPLELRARGRRCLIGNVPATRIEIAPDGTPSPCHATWP